MRTLEMKQATGDLSSYAAQVGKEPMVVTENGKPVMALIPITDADLETIALSTDPRFIALIERSRELYKPGTGIPLEEIRRRYRLGAKNRKASSGQRAKNRRPRR